MKLNLYKIDKTLTSLIFLFKYYFVIRFYLYFKYKITKFKIFKFFLWHGGAAYFLAKFNSEKVFIKIDWKSRGILSNEQIALNLLSYEKGGCHFPRVLIHAEKFGIDFVVLEHIDGFSLNTLQTDQVKDIDSFLIDIGNQFVEIIKAFQKKDIIHRDIRPDNILVNLKGEKVRIIIIDFAYSTSQNKQNGFIEINSLPDGKAILKTLGEEFKPDAYSWDDSHSFFMIYEELLKNNKKQTQIIEEIKKNIGVLTYTADVF